MEQPTDSLEKIIAGQRAYFCSGQTLPVSFRVGQLRKLQREVARRHADLEAALAADLKRHRLETFLAESLQILTTLKSAIKNTPRWAAPQKIRPSIFNFFSRDAVLPEPYGSSLIISPWNYPLLLALGPLAAAISAGNCALLKPSELAPAASGVLAEIIGATFPPDYVAVVQGGADTARAILQHRFDKIFFTGSAAVGRQVLAAAARHITPVTLELGGKSPCIVTASANLPVAARRIIWGKLLNAGQTCVAPDYVLVQRSKKDELLAQLAAGITAFYGNDIRHNPDYPRIVNARHHARLAACLDPAKLVWGGEHDGADLYFGPAIMDNVAWDDPVMQEEIFGPILPVLAYDSLDEAIERINAGAKPLALYLFGSDKKEVEALWTRCRFGGGCVNDTLSHFINDRLPFGGLGESGLGSYHGRWGFEAFSHHKSLLRRGLRPDLPLRYPPYADKGWLKKLLLKMLAR